MKADIIILVDERTRHDGMVWENISKEQEQAVLNLLNQTSKQGVRYSIVTFTTSEPYEYGEEERIRNG